MSKLEQALKDSEEDFWISNDDRLQLIDMLAMIAAALESGKLYFNQPGIEYNKQFADFAQVMAKRFANMPVIKEV